MLRPRISPILLLSGSGCVKSKSFLRFKYLGDIINTIKIFNELGVDELVIYDFDKYRNKAGSDAINFDLLRKISRESSMPLAYGGGVNSIEEARILVGMGFEKVSFCSNALSEKLINGVAEAIGMQSVILHFDYRECALGKKIFFINSGGTKIKSSIHEIIDYVNRIQPGEVCFQSITRDGSKHGFDLCLIRFLKGKLNSPIKISGGCGSTSDILDAHSVDPLVSYGCAGLFVLHGKFDAVLLSYDKPGGWL